jgi:transcriptional regulator with GAF, ATPase, and Fis domain
VRIEKATGASKPDGKTLSLLVAGDYLGEMSLFDRKPRSASAVAAGSVRALRLSSLAFERLLQESNAVAVSVLFGMIRTASDRIRRLDASVVVYDQIGRAIGESANLQQLLDVVLRQLCQGTQADWGLLLLRPQFAERFEVRSSENITLTPAQKIGLSEGKGLLNFVLQCRHELIIGNLQDEQQFRSCHALGIESPSMLLVPILVNQEFLGIILLGHQQAGHFDLNDLNLAVGVARQAAQAILNARHREEEELRARLERRFVRF